jgi:hypothetical protein
MARRYQLQQLQQLLLAAEARLLLTAAFQRPRSHAADMRMSDVHQWTLTAPQQRTARAPVSTRDLSEQATVQSNSHADLFNNLDNQSRCSMSECGQL